MKHISMCLCAGDSAYLRVLMCTLDAVEDISRFWVITVHLRILSDTERKKCQQTRLAQRVAEGGSRRSLYFKIKGSAPVCGPERPSRRNFDSFFPAIHFNLSHSTYIDFVLLAGFANFHRQVCNHEHAGDSGENHKAILLRERCHSDSPETGKYQLVVRY